VSTATAPRPWPAASRSVARRIAPRDHLFGDPTAVIQVVVYGDLTSPATAEAHFAAHEAIFFHPCIRTTLRHRALGPAGRECAAAAEAVAPYDLFWPFVDEVLRSGSTPDDLRRHCRTLGLDERVVAAPLAEPRIARRLEDDRWLADAAGATTDPTVFVNGTRWERSAAMTLVDDLCRLSEVTRPLWSSGRHRSRPAPTTLAGRLP
jgi:protein-disulfide isomerase